MLFIWEVELSFFEHCFFMCEVEAGFDIGAENVKLIIAIS